MKQARSVCPEDLVAAMEHTLGYPLVSSVRAAFLQIPRHLFIERYYEGVQITLAPPVSQQADWQAWLSAIYRDRALTTQVDEQGLPTSSSSQPSVMARMLEALDVQPGMRVLEIGTGTGYNAALLAHLTGDPRLVTTLEIDPSLVPSARSRIEQVVGEGMTVNVSDGKDGSPSQAPYDRIIATGSCFPVPRAWVEQLKVGGRLVMDLRGYMGGGIIVAHRQNNGWIRGEFLASCAGISFMRLRSATEEFISPPIPQGYQHSPLQEIACLTEDEAASACARHFCTYEQFRGTDEAVNPWLQWSFPALSLKWKGKAGKALHAVLTDLASQTVMTIEQQEHTLEIVVRGTRPLWSEILHAYQDWQQAGQPGRESTTLLIDPQGRQSMQIEHAGHRRSFPLTPLSPAATMPGRQSAAIPPQDFGDANGSSRVANSFGPLW